MIDQADIVVSSGRGGDGAISGRHEKFVPKGGPDGGDGGDGGSVIIMADRNLNTLGGFRYRRRFEAESGASGRGALKHGRKGRDVVVTVPVGTQVHERTAGLISDLDADGERFVAAAGGQGGRGNASFATSVNQFPLLAEAGEGGSVRELRLELKLLADVGLVGLPNAGKSSLLRAVSNARPRVAPYPFTTLEPSLGVVEHRGSDVVVADIPGLIEGASEGVGLGLDFLRHVERARILVHVIDAAAEDPVADEGQIVRELQEYEGGLADKPRIVALNKMDIPQAQAHRDRLLEAFAERGQHAVAISAAARTGLTGLLDAVAQTLAAGDEGSAGRPPLAERLAGGRARRRRTDDREDGTPVLRPKPVDRAPAVAVRDGVYVIDSPRAVRIAAMVDPESWPARQQFYAHLRRMGIVRRLEELGISTGDTVRLGDTEWEWA